MRTTTTRPRRFAIASAFLAVLLPCIALSLPGCSVSDETRRQLQLQAGLGDDIEPDEVEELLKFAWDRHALGATLDRPRVSTEGFWLFLQNLDPLETAIDPAQRLVLLSEAATGPAGFARALGKARDAWCRAMPSQPITYTRAAERAVECVFRRMDPHSSFFDRDRWQAQIRSITGNYSGIGIVVQYADEPLVAEVFEEGPANGILRKGDRILTVNGTAIRGLPSESYLALIRGEADTDVALGIRRGEQLFDVTLTRRKLKTHAVRSFDAGPGRDVLVVRLRSYTEGSADEVEDAVRRHKSALRGIILDLRDNPGGTVDDAVAIVDLFIDTGPVIIERGREIKQLDAESTGSAVSPRIPLLVLVNRHSASASELTAEALQDHGRAIVMGEQTYGKGTVQEIYRMGDRGAKVTVACFLSPLGRSNQLVGVTPDLLFNDTQAEAWALLVPPGNEANLEREYDNAIPPERIVTMFRRTADPKTLLDRLRKLHAARAKVEKDPEIDEDDLMLQEAVRLLASEEALPAR